MSNSCQLLENFFKIKPISSSQKDSQCYTKDFIAVTTLSAVSTKMKEKSSTICVRKYSHNVIQIRLQWIKIDWFLIIFFWSRAILFVRILQLQRTFDKNFLGDGDVSQLIHSNFKCQGIIPAQTFCHVYN